MLLSETDIKLFSERNIRQLANLIKALEGHHQKVFNYPDKQVSKLSLDCAGDLRASSPHARNLFMRAIGGALVEELGIGGPGYHLRKPVYFLTISNGDHNRISQAQFDDYNDPSIRDFRRPLEDFVNLYNNYLWRPIDCIAIVEPAMYVYCQRHFSVAPIYHYHAHGIVWNTSKRDLRTLCDDIRGRCKPFLSHATSAHCAKIRKRDLLQMLWYISKYPYKQHQLYRTNTFKGPMNGVNAVRIYEELRHTTLRDLSFARGRGVSVLKKAYCSLDAINKVAGK